MKYKLLKDLPDLKAGAVFERQGSLYENIDGKGNKYLPIDVENNPEWFEPIPERITLIYNSTQSSKVIHSSKSLEMSQLRLMEKAINGELLDIDSLNDDDFLNYLTYNEIGTYVNHTYCIDNIKEVLKEYLKQRDVY